MLLQNNQLSKVIIILVFTLLVIQASESIISRKKKGTTNIPKKYPDSVSKSKTSTPTPLDYLPSTCRPKNLEDIHECDDHTKDKNHEFCYKFYEDPKSWHDAHVQCRSDAGFLTDHLTWNLGKSWKPRSIITSNIWTALTNIGGRYQWLSRCPGPVESSPVTWETKPGNFDKDCAALNISLDIFKLQNCYDELPFYCILQPKLEKAESIIDGIEFRVNTGAEVYHNLVNVSQTEFEQLTLSCDVYNKTSNQKLDWQHHVIWKKDGVFLNYYNKILQPSSLERLSDSLSYIVGKDKKTLNGSVWRQGTYSCGTWKPLSKNIIESNKMLITLKEWLTLIIDSQITHRNDTNMSIDIGVDDFDSELLNGARGILFENFKTCGKTFPRTLISVDKDKEFLHYKLHLHCLWSDMQKSNEEQSYHDYYRNSFEEYNKKDSRKFNYTIENSYILHPTYCWPCKGNPKHTKNYPCKNNRDQYGNMMEWENSSIGTTKASECELTNHEISPLMCTWNFTDGAKFSYENPNCERTDKCPRGYTSIDKIFCVKIIERLSWTDGLNEIYSIGNEINMIDLFEGNMKTTFEHIRKLLINESGFSEIWLPFQRKQEHAPFVYMGKGEISCDILKVVPDCGISWAPGYPIGTEKCLALDLNQTTLRSLSCNEKFSFISIVNSTKVSNNEYDTSLCTNDWRATNLNLKEVVCYRVFDHSDTPYNWTEALHFCENNNSTLPLPSEGYMSWFYKDLLRNDKIDSVWMGIRKINTDLDFLDAYVDKVNWISNTNYSNQYGSLSEKGWALEVPFKKKNYTICQRKIYKRNSALKIERKNETSKFTINVYPQNTSSDFEQKMCFENGRSIKYFNDSFNATNIGYYECDAWSNSYPKLHKSNKILFKKADIMVVIIDMDLEEQYKPEEMDSTFLDALPKDPCNIVDAISNLNLTKISNCKIRWLSYEPNKHCTTLSSTLECDTKELSDFYAILFLENEFSKIYSNTNCSLVDVRSAFYCLPHKTYDVYTNQTLSWSAKEGPGISLSDELCITNLSEPVTRKCQGDFYNGYQWDKPDGKCNGKPTELTKLLWKTWDQTKNHTGTLLTLSNITSLAKSLSAVDIHLVAMTLKKLTKIIDYNNLNINDIVKTVNSIMKADSSIVNSINNKLNSTGIILESFEKLLFKVGNSALESIYHIKSAESLVSADRIEMEEGLNVRGYKSSKCSKGKCEEVIFESSSYNNAKAVILLPSNLTKKISEKSSKLRYKEERVQVLFTVYKDGILFEDNNSYPNFTLNSYIIGASFNQNEDLVRNISEDVEILFKPNLRSKSDFKCVFWDFSKNSNKGGWSTEGCKLGVPRNGYSICLCNHLTSFAQLVNLNDIDPIHLYVLDTISIIGCSLSIICIALVFVTFILFKKWREDTDNKVLANLSLAIFFSMIIFLSGINAVSSDTVCRSVAAALHYFILASFAWSLAEASLLYLKFVKVVGAHVPNFIWKASICAWGIPVFPVFGVLLVDNNHYFNEYSELCWIGKEAFDYAFLPFLILTVGINFFVYILIIYKVTCGRRTIQMSYNQPPKNILLNQVFMAIFIFFLLGLTWLFGLLAMYDRTLIFSYLFCLFNTFQGFFLFLVMIMPKNGAKVLWGEFLSILSKSSKSKSAAFSSPDRATISTSLSASSPLRSPLSSVGSTDRSTTTSITTSTTTSFTNQDNNEKETLFDFPNSWVDASKWTNKEILGNSGNYTPIQDSLQRRKKI